jgi:hypothetical protein
MKKILLLLLIAMLSFSSFSQSRTSFGLRGGVNASKLSNTNMESKTSFYLGALVHIKLSDIYVLQPELGYSGQGGQTRFANEKDVNIHYISLSFANKFFVKKSGFHFIIAPGLDFDADDSLVSLINRQEGNDVTFIDLNMGVGIGVEFKNGLGVEARYKQGLIDVFSGTWHRFESQQYEDETQLNGVFQIGLLYKF